MRVLLVAAVGAALMSSPAAADSDRYKNVVFDVKAYEELESEARLLKSTRNAYLVGSGYKRLSLFEQSKRLASNDADQLTITLSRLAAIYTAFCKL